MLPILIILIIAISLALDAAAAAMACGANPKFSKQAALLMAILCGLFQYMMTLSGWFFGQTFSTAFMAFKSWLILLIMTILGLKMITEALKTPLTIYTPPLLNLSKLLILAFITSIDALAIGLSLAFWQININLAAIIIGLTAFILALGGGLAGRLMAKILGPKALLIAGAILIFIGVKQFF